MKKNWCKKMGKIVGACVLAIGFVGCNTSPSSDYTVRFAMWGSSDGEILAMDNTIAQFTAKTGIKVQKEVISDKYMDVMKSRFAANSAPDVFYVDSFEAPGLMKSGVLDDLSSVIDNQDDFYESFLKSFQDSNGTLYGVPKDYSTLSLYLNLDLLEEAGVSATDVPQDFSGLLQFAQNLQDKLPKGTGAMVVEKDLARHLSALEGMGAKVMSDDGKAQFDQSQEAKQYLEQLVKGHQAKYLHSAKEDLGADWAGAAFGTNKAAMMLEGNWVLSALHKDYANVKFEAREMPTVNNKKQTMAFTVGYGVAKNSTNKEAAYQFIQYMTDEGQEQWAQESGTLPTRKSITEKMNLFANPELASHIAGAEYATVWARGETLPIINTNFGNQFLAAFNGQEKLEDAIANIDKISNDEIQNQT